MFLHFRFYFSKCILAPINRPDLLGIIFYLAFLASAFFPAVQSDVQVILVMCFLVT